MEAGKLERRFHQMNTPEMPCREGRTFTLGRNVSRDRNEAELILCHSDFVSRQHCDVHFKNGAFWIKDLKSLNGTFLNGQKLIPLTERELRFGDMVGLGISHDSTEVNVEDSEYFIFLFKAHQYELINLDDEDDGGIVLIEQSVSPPKMSLATVEQESSEKNLEMEAIISDEEEIEIIEEISSPSISPSKTISKPLPPAPPPPIISERISVLSVDVIKGSNTLKPDDICSTNNPSTLNNIFLKKSSDIDAKLETSKPQLDKPNKPCSSNHHELEVPNKKPNDSKNYEFKLPNKQTTESNSQKPFKTPLPEPPLLDESTKKGSNEELSANKSLKKMGNSSASELFKPGPASSKKRKETNDPHKSDSAFQSNSNKIPASASSLLQRKNTVKVPNAPSSVASTVKGISPKSRITNIQIPKTIKSPVTTESSSDDSSDGMSESFSQKNFVRNVELSPESVEENHEVVSPTSPHNRVNIDPSNHLPIIAQNVPPNNVQKPNNNNNALPLSNQSLIQIKSEPQDTLEDEVVAFISPQKLIDNIHRRKCIVKLRQLIIIDKNTGEFTMKKTKFDNISASNREKIARQFQASRKRNMKRKSEDIKRSSSSGDDYSSDSSDLMIPITTKRRKKSSSSNNFKQKETEEFIHKPVKKFKRITMTSSSDSDSQANESLHKPRRKRSKNSTNTRESLLPIIKRSSEDKVKGKDKVKVDNDKNDDKNEPIAGSSRNALVDHHNINLETQSLSPVSNHDLNDDQESYYSDISDSDNLVMDVEPEEKSEPLPSLSPNDYRKGQGRRQIVIIDNAPPPPEVQRRLNFSLHKTKFEMQQRTIKKTVIVKQGSPRQEDGGSNISIKEKLQSIALVGNGKQQQQPELPKPKVPAPVRTKTMRRNRNDDLLESLMANEQVQKELERATPSRSEEIMPPPPIVSSKPVAAPRREIPLPTPEIQAKMPVNQISANMNRFKKDQQNIHPYRNNVNLPPNKQLNRVMENPTSSSTVFTYDHNSPVPKELKIGGYAIKPSPDKFVAVIPSDEAHKVILKWRPAWLTEQTKQSKLPPIAGGREILRTHHVYSDYKSYMETFFPLLLLEIWATITQDVSNTKKPLEEQSRETDTRDFPISIDTMYRVNDCPMLQKGKGKDSKEDPYWTVLQCHVITTKNQKMSLKKDFAIVKLRVSTQDEHKNWIQKEKDYFGFILNHSEKDAPIAGIASGSVMVNPHLLKTNPLAVNRHSFTVVIHLSIIDRLELPQLGTISRISYLSPKLRDFKAMNSLHNSKLYNSIVYPKPPTVPWSQYNPIPKHQLTQHMSKLNETQRSVVSYVSDRVQSNDPEVLLLHGPPGTGKTRTIVGMILQILLTKDRPKVATKPKILVCTPSNTAIDEIMQRLEEAMTDLPRNSEIFMVRVGECDGSIMKKYSLDSQARYLEEKSSIAASIQASIKQCVKDIDEKKAEIEMLRKNSGSKTTIESLRRELREIESRKEDFKSDLSRRRIDKAPFHAQKRNVLEKANVVCSTLNSCSNSFLSNMYGRNSGKSKPFTCCIVDEASQTTEPETLAPLLLQIDKLILVGDPNQLSATILSSEAAKKDYGMSLFTRLHYYFTQVAKNSGAFMMLKQQYRMHPEILSWPNDYFYKSLLQTRCIGRSDDDICPLKPYLFLNLSSQESSNNEGQISNEEEVKMVVEIIRNIHLVVSTNVRKSWSIGVITPYSTQKGVIMRTLKRELPTISNKVEVNTVDSFQGKERDIIIISCVRTDDTGFLKNPFRLNVALTRARHSLLMIGDAECLKKDSMWRSLIENANERKCLYDIPSSDWSNPGFLRKRLFVALSPTKSQIPDEMRHRDWLG